MTDERKGTVVWFEETISEESSTTRFKVELDDGGFLEVTLPLAKPEWLVGGARVVITGAGIIQA